MNSRRQQQIYIHELGNKENNALQTITNENKKIIHSIEDLSNEILYNIFDYLDGCHLYESFANLNARFQNLLIKSFLSLKINIDSKYEIIIEYCHVKQFLKLITINSLFNRLQSLVINGIVEHKLQLLLKQLASLPCFCSLNISVVGSHHQQNNQFTSLFWIKRQ
ncbi:unnamed protein product [Rotaria sp. Silwood1]|nr:unnamed protein product [Rotaria sp. Silwood1]CAF4865622.1 unnamed protein product [Rotaria sp. Silwood1]